MNDDPAESGGQGHPLWMASLLGDTLPDAPYPGLRAFEADEEVIFFGRDQHVNAVLSRLAKANFVAVVGPSGCGKSSLVKAGVIPALEAGRYYDAGTDWAVAQMRPGTSPLWNLARALLLRFESDGEPEPARIAEASSVLVSSKKPLTTLLRELNVPKERNVLILVDQFEELFRYETQSIDAEEGDDFVSLLLALQRGEEENVSGIITMRTDHFGDCTRFDGLPEAINETLFLTPRLNETERRAAIEGPIRLFGDQISPELTDALIGDMTGVDDQLPLMQHVLLRLWRRASNDGANGGMRLTLEAYHELGGLHEALDRHAGEVMAEIERALGATGLALTESMFRQLTERRDDSAGQDVRRPLRYGILADASGIDDADGRRELGTVVGVFVRPDVGFLRLEGASDTLDDETVIDIVHECLIRKWSSLQDWVAREWEASKKLRDLVASAGLRKGTGTYLNSEDASYYAKWCDETQPNGNWASRYGVSAERLDDALRFLDKSIDLARSRKRQEREELEGEARRQEIAKRRKFMLAGAVLSVCVLLVAAYVIERRAQERYETRIKEFYDTQKELSELIHRQHRVNAVNMLDLVKKTSSQSSVLDGAIVNPKLRFAQFEKFEAQKKRLRTESDATLGRAMGVSREIGFDREADQLISDFKARREEIWTSFDAHMLQLHAEIQRDIGNIPRARLTSQPGDFSAVAIRPDGRIYAAAGVRSVGTGDADRYEWGISLWRIPEVGETTQDLAERLTPTKLPVTSVLQMAFSRDGRYLAAIVSALGRDLAEQAWLLVWDIRNAAPIEQTRIPWESTDFAAIAMAVSEDSRNVAVAAAGGRYLVCAIGRCSQASDRSAVATGRVEVTNKTDAITETLIFLSLVPGRDGGFISVYASQESVLWGYRLSLDASRADGGRLISEPDYRLPWMPQFQPKPREEGESLHYCAAQDTLIAIDQRATALLAWRLSGTGPPDCSARFVQAVTGGPLELWKTPGDPASWRPAAEIAPGSGRLFKGWQDRSFVAKLDTSANLISAFRFPARIVRYDLDRAGRTLVTLALLPPSVGASAGEPVRDGIVASVWRSHAGQQVAYLGGYREMKAAAVGFDPVSRRILWGKADGEAGAVRVAGAKGATAVAYRFDAEHGLFVPRAGGSEPIHALRWSDRQGVEVASAGGKARIKVSLKSKDGVVASFQPTRLWRHQSSDIAFAVLSRDRKLAALSIPGGGGRATGEPVLEIWDVEAGELRARILSKSRILGAVLLDGGRLVATLTKEHGAWISVWRPDDLKAELCTRLREFDRVGVPVPGEKDVCSPR